MPTLSKHADCISDLTFDTGFAGEIDAAARQALEAHLAGCVRCCLRRDALLTQRRAFLERVPAWEALAPARKRRPLARLAADSTLTLVAAAALLLAYLPKHAQNEVRSKGGGQLGVFIKRGEQVTRAQSGDLIEPGDLLRMTYTTSQRREFALLHRDANRASIYYPLAERSAQIAPGRDVALDFSIRVDELPGEERLIALFCDESLLLPPLRAALQATGGLPPLAHCQIDTMTLTKQLGHK